MCEKRTRRQAAYIIRDARSNTLILTQKLRLAVEFMNNYLASSEMERVTVQSLFEAANTDGNRVNGMHKLRYNVSRWNLGVAHRAFEDLQSQYEPTLALILTSDPNCYNIV